MLMALHAPSQTHHLVNYMEHENSSPALHWFNYAGLAAAAEMEWNKEKECPTPKSKIKLSKLATMEFDWLDCPDLAQADTIDHPQIDTNDLSISSFDIGHLPSGKADANNNSLAMAQASVVGTVNKDADPPANTAAPGA